MKQWLLAMRIMVEQEKKKAAMLTGLGLILLIAIVRAWFMLGPSAGQAAVSPQDSGVSSLASAGSDAVTRAIASDDAKFKGRFIEIARSPRTSRNLFELDSSQYPESVVTAPSEQVAQATQTPPSEPSTEGRTENAIESETQNADVLAERLKAQLLEETAGWRLSSVILGQQPIAVVEAPPVGGRGASKSAMLRMGQSLHEWTVVEITSSTVVLEKQKVRVRMSLAKPEP